MAMDWGTAIGGIGTAIGGVTNMIGSNKQAKTAQEIAKINATTASKYNASKEAIFKNGFMYGSIALVLITVILLIMKSGK